MSKSNIEWTMEVWNPVTGCNKVSPGCKNCYAEKMHKRLRGMGQEKYKREFLDGAFPWEKDLLVPIKIKKPTVFFVNSMSDLFHDMVPVEYIKKVFAVMALCPQHTFQVLTKRDARMMHVMNTYPDSEFIDAAADIIVHTHPEMFYEQGEYGFEDGEKVAILSNTLKPHLVKAGWYSGTLPVGDCVCGVEHEPEFYYEGKWPLPNVWLGVSTENQIQAEDRIHNLLLTPAAVRMVSMEPMLEEIDLSVIDGARTLDWIIVGGESGHKRRPFNTDWARKIRDWCQYHQVPFFMKQIDKVKQVPETLMIREYPKTFVKK